SLFQPVLPQPPSASASLGASAKLTCTLSSGCSRRGPRFLMRVGTSGVAGSKGDGISDWSLTFQNIQDEDKADYICGAAHGSGSSFV
ncbi:hypothetical protein FD755_018057, partial [Muntiacus reevesi]